MNIKAIKNTMTKSAYRMGFKLKKYSPEILVVSGAIGVVASAVMACKATTKLGSILEESHDQVEQIHEYAEREDMVVSGKYTEENAKKDLFVVYVQTGVKIAKLYAPSVILGSISLGSMIASNNILRKRNVALAAAYTTIEKSFKKYRSNVIERFGEKVDKELKYGVKAQKIEEVETDPGTGKQKKVKKTIETTDYDGYSQYARFYDESCKNWKKDAEANLIFLRAQERYANDLLHARGYLFLNEVYDMLGIQITKEGQLVGWVYSDDPNFTGANYVDFGMNEIHRDKVRDFVNGYERTILLDFNVDGNIWELMK